MAEVSHLDLPVFRHVIQVFKFKTRSENLKISQTPKCTDRILQLWRIITRSKQYKYLFVWHSNLSGMCSDTYLIGHRSALQNDVLLQWDLLFRRNPAGSMDWAHLNKFPICLKVAVMTGGWVIHHRDRHNPNSPLSALRLSPSLSLMIKQNQTPLLAGDKYLHQQLVPTQSTTTSQRSEFKKAGATETQAEPGSSFVTAQEEPIDISESLVALSRRGYSRVN